MQGRPSKLGLKFSPSSNSQALHLGAIYPNPPRGITALQIVCPAGEDTFLKLVQRCPYELAVPNGSKTLLPSLFSLVSILLLRAPSPYIF